MSRELWTTPSIKENEFLESMRIIDARSAYPNKLIKNSLYGKFEKPFYVEKSCKPWGIWTSGLAFGAACHAAGTGEPWWYVAAGLCLALLNAIAGGLL